MSLSEELFRVGGEHIAVTVQYGIPRRARFPARGEPRGAEALPALRPRARARGARPACAGKGTENAPSPPENSRAHLENGNLFIYQSSHVHEHDA